MVVNTTYQFDYYPFGMIMPGRSFSSESYRYGFQGQEIEEELYDGSASFFKYRISDNRLGRFFSRDPLSAEFPWNSPYAFSENRVIDGIELEGLEVVLVNSKDDPILYEFGINYYDSDPYTEHVFTHGSPTSMGDYRSGNRVNIDVNYFDKVMNEISEKWVDNKSSGKMIVVLHSCRTGSETEKNGVRIKAYAAKLSIEYPNVTFVAPTERLVVSSSTEKGIFKAKYTDPNGEYNLIKADGTFNKELTDKVGIWLIFQNGEKVGLVNKPINIKGNDVRESLRGRELEYSKIDKTYAKPTTKF